jgi:hypothetical protein
MKNGMRKGNVLFSVCMRDIMTVAPSQCVQTAARCETDLCSLSVRSRDTVAARVTLAVGLPPARDCPGLPRMSRNRDSLFNVPEELIPGHRMSRNRRLTSHMNTHSS